MHPEEIAKLQAKAQKKFSQGMKAYGDGFPAPPMDTPERYGWEAMEEMTLIKKKAMKEMYDAIEEE